MAGVSKAALSPGQAIINEASRTCGGIESQTVLEECKKGLQASGYKVKTPAPHNVQVKVKWLGVMGTRFGNDVKIDAIVSVYDSNARLLWKIEYTGMSSAKRELKDYKANPSLYKTDFMAAARDLGAKLMK